MNAPVAIDGKVYLPADADQLREIARELSGLTTTLIARSVGFENLADDIEKLEAEIAEVERLKRLGHCSPVPDTWERIIEFEGRKLARHFGESWTKIANFQRKKLRIYDLEADYGNAIHLDLFKPEFDQDDGSLEFAFRGRAAGNPSLVNAYKTSPLFGGGNDGFESLGAHNIVKQRLFRWSFEIMISPNFWQHFRTVAERTQSRHLSFAQLKQTYSWTSQQVLGLLWDYWPASEPQFRIVQYGDTRRAAISDPDKFETNRIVKGIPMRPGHWQQVEIQMYPDPTGAKSETIVWIDGHKQLTSTDVNCFPCTTQNYPVGLRGFYFGAYFGTTPQITFPEPVVVKYRNISVDVQNE